ncbi:MAG: AMP-binding protein, partial [Candidatus Binatia bacterium]
MSKGALGLLAAYWPEDTPRYAHVPLKLVTEVTVHAVAAEAPERPALVTGAGTLAYGELSERIRRAASALSARAERGSRVAVAVSDPADLLSAAFGAIEAGMLAWMTAEMPPPEILTAFSPRLLVGESAAPEIERVGIRDLLSAAGGERRSGRPDFKGPVLALAKPDRSGETLHNQKTLAATAIAVASFYMIDAGTRVLFLEPPTDWLGLSLLLGVWRGGGTAVCAFGANPAPLPDRVDYLASGWEQASRRLLDDPRFRPGPRIGAGAIVGIEGPFSLSRRRRIARRLRTPVLTLFGRNDVGPVIGSHPTWFLDDAAGIPLPNVDTRPLDPADGTPLGIGWDAVEEAELGVKSALAPAGGTLVEGWLRSERMAAIDPTGVYFFRPPGR